ncbi:MAG: hypothetical protein QGH73_02435 [Rhodospirillales bacterium]|jgi:hypothetical protein|nr:hypothetical protein [Rhodospirillaceae bacterium]MAF49625.1 hypothetical protein [Rhodospirillaceae bacterium]MDP6428924.1 hypothetical protein [Rhodospirillales bacterium]MDP6644951.1 hypothetical protein [Rhodospirillales bacterium]MDP6840513.1 hypothetical protein [Rhodospirillales bacterium]|tara:strand:+ start:1068 stop:1355 length:288 start_codon:yes stop_codon:yes gene_type:complete
MPSKEYAHFKDFSASPVPPEERRKIWLEISDITGEELDQMFADQKARQVRVPAVGEPAPDFEAELIDRNRKRTGETVKLSALRGKPVALVFGSYT